MCSLKFCNKQPALKGALAVQLQRFYVTRPNVAYALGAESVVQTLDQHVASQSGFPTIFVFCAFWF